MPDGKISALTELSTPDGGDRLAIVDDPTGTPATLQVQLKTLINGLTALTTPAIADEVALYDASGAVLRKMVLSDLLAVINLLSEDTTPVSGDFLLSYDISASAVKKADFAKFGTKRLNLPIGAAHLPDDSAGSAAAQLQMKLTSSATDPQVRWLEALFDDTTDEHLYWQFAMPSNYVSAPVLDVYYKATSATSGTAAFNATMKAISDGDATDLDADAFAGEQVTAGTATVPATAGYMDVISITLATADSVAANDWVVLGLLRDVSADSVVGDLEVVQCVLRYS